MMSPVDSKSAVVLTCTAWPLVGKNCPFCRSMARLLLGSVTVVASSTCNRKTQHVMHTLLRYLALASCTHSP